MTSAAKSLSSVLLSSRVSLATPSCLDTCPPLNLTRSYSTVGDGTPIGRADASIDHPLSTSSFLKILAESDLPITYPSPLLTITPSSVEGKEGHLSDGKNAAASALSAAATTICEDNAAGDGSRIFNTPAAVPLSFDSWLDTPSSGLFAAEEPASPITIVGLGTGCVASIGAIVDTYADELLEKAGHDAALGTAS